jgi:hypothetical protein
MRELNSVHTAHRKKTLTAVSVKIWQIYVMRSHETSVARMEENRNPYKILIGKPEGKVTHGVPI